MVIGAGSMAHHVVIGADGIDGKIPFLAASPHH